MNKEYYLKKEIVSSSESANNLYLEKRIKALKKTINILEINSQAKKKSEQLKIKNLKTLINLFYLFDVATILSFIKAITKDFKNKIEIIFTFLISAFSLGITFWKNNQLKKTKQDIAKNNWQLAKAKEMLDHDETILLLDNTCQKEINNTKQNEEAKTIYMLSGNQLEEEIQRELDEGYETYLNKQKTRIRKK